MGTPTNEFIHEKKGSVDSESNFMDDVPLLEKTQQLERSDETTEYGQSPPSRSCPSILLHSPLPGGRLNRFVLLRSPFLFVANQISNPADHLY